jgi:ribosomal protein L23
MPLKPSTIFFPEMALTLVRRASAKLPYNHFLFRTDPKWTKNEIKEYLRKVYNVDVARITTYISPGEWACYRSQTATRASASL